ncbi:hypothetical protein, partial [Chryseobacterium piperi]
MIPEQIDHGIPEQIDPQKKVRKRVLNNLAKKYQMANKRIDMLNIKQLLRLYTQGVSKLRISKQLGISRNTAKKYISLFH